jgi:hypothetical protein
MMPQTFSARIRREEIEALRKTERLASVQLSYDAASSLNERQFSRGGL